MGLREGIADDVIGQGGIYESMALGYADNALEKLQRSLVSRNIVEAL